jgi:hypothetical protein
MYDPSGAITVRRPKARYATYDITGDGAGPADRPTR